MTFKLKANGHALSVFKALSWRGFAALDTFLLTFLITGKLTAAFGVVGFEVFTKTAMFYGHERLWVMLSRWSAAAAAA